MAKGVAKFAFAIFASIIAGAPLASKAQDATDAATQDKPAAADDCLTAPNGEAPQGQHWFYRTEHGTQRHCWYLHDRPERAAQPAATSAAGAATKSLARTGDAATARPAIILQSRPNADARAELPTPRGRFESDALATPRLQPAAAMAAKAAPTMAADDDIRGQGTVSLSQPLDTFSAPPPSPEASAVVPDDAGTNANTDPGTASAPATMATPDANARTDAAPPKASLQMLLVAIFGALAFAGVTASLMHRLAQVWRKRAARLRRHVMWKSAHAARSRTARAAHANDAVPDQRTGTASPNQPDDDTQGQIEELLSRVKRQAPSTPALANSRAAAATRGQRSSARRGARA